MVTIYINGNIYINTMTPESYRNEIVLSILVILLGIFILFGKSGNNSVKNTVRKAMEQIDNLVYPEILE